MAETSYPFDGMTVDEQQWSELAAFWQDNGVNASGPSANQCLVFGDATGLQVKMSAGQAFIRGAFYENTAEQTITISANSSGSPRIDRVVLRRSYTSNTIVATVIEGTPGASPQPPGLTRVSGGIWEIPLASVRVNSGAVTITAGNVTDERLFMGTRVITALDLAAFELRYQNPRQGQLCWLTSDQTYRYYDGTEWKKLGPESDTGWVLLTAGPGWNRDANKMPEARRIGEMVHLRGRFLRNLGPTPMDNTRNVVGYLPSAGTNLWTPPKPVRVFTTVIELAASANVTVTELWANATGELYIPLGMWTGDGPDKDSSMNLSGSFIRN
jgi:hypothetical protein